MKSKIDISYEDDVKKQVSCKLLSDAQIKKWIASIAQKMNIDNFEVSILFCSDETIRELNKNYRNIDEVTDVLSFSQTEGEDVGFEALSEMKFLGDIAISLPQTERQSVEDNHTSDFELKNLILHGILHLLGYDHEKDNGEMLELQKSFF